MINKLRIFFGLSNKNKVEPAEMHVDNAVKLAEFLSQNVAQVYSSISFDMPQSGDHLSLLIFEPTQQRDYYLLVTSGVSDVPMPRRFKSVDRCRH